MALCVMVLNGANLNLLGSREPEIYGERTLADIEALCRARVAEHASADEDWSMDFRQDNAEGVLIDCVQEAARSCAGLVINPGGYAHTSVGLRDALLSCNAPKIEVHLSNLYKRESFRRRSLSAAGVDGVITGLGGEGYLLALDGIVALYRGQILREKTLREKTLREQTLREQTLRAKTSTNPT